MALFKRHRFKQRSNPPTVLQLRFLEQLSYLLENGYSLLRALEILAWEKTYKTISMSIQHQLKTGKYIDEALLELHFHHSISSYLYFVRLHGDLAKHINACAKMFARKQTYEKTFKRAIRYPLFLSIFFGILFICIKQFVLPSFETMLSSQGSSSTIVQTILKIINISFFLGGSFVLCISILTFAWKWKKKTLSIHSRIQFYKRIPFFRSYVRLKTSHQLATHMATLFQSGLTMKEMLLYLQKQTKLPIISHYALHIQHQLHAGIQFSEIFSTLDFIESHLGQIFQKNKDQQTIEKDLNMYAVIVTEEMHRKSMQFITFIQPLFFGFIALFIISMYIALMWPMFQMIQTI